MIPDVTPNGVFYLPPTGWLTSFYNPPILLIMKKIYFLCTGNSCRSQIAEGYAKLLLKNQ